MGGDSLLEVTSNAGLFQQSVRQKVRILEFRLGDCPICDIKRSRILMKKTKSTEWKEELRLRFLTIMNDEQFKAQRVRSKT